MTNRQSVEVLNDSDDMGRKLDWILFKHEQEKLLAYREGEWNVGDWIPGHRPTRRYLIDEYDLHTFSGDCNFIIYERCWECGVDWLGDDPCFVCGIDREELKTIRYPDRESSRFQHGDETSTPTLHGLQYGRLRVLHNQEWVEVGHTSSEGFSVVETAEPEQPVSVREELMTRLAAGLGIDRVYLESDLMPRAFSHNPAGIRDPSPTSNT